MAEIKTFIDTNTLELVRTQKPNWLDTGKEMPVYRVKISELHYNEENGRIATWISTYNADGDKPPLSSLSREEYNDAIEAFIRRANSKESLNDLIVDIQKKTQINPGVILDDGTVVSGNRRFTALRSLYEKDCDQKFEYFECFVLPYPKNKGDKEFIKLIETKTQFGVVTEEDYNPIDRLVTVYRYLINEETKIWSIKEYAKKIGIKESDAENLYERALIMMDFLEYIGQKNAFHIAREKKLDGPIVELVGIYKKLKISQMNEWIRISPLFFSEMNKTEGDRTREVRRLKKTYLSDRSRFEELLGNLYKLQAEVEQKLREKTIVHTSVKVDTSGNEIPLVSLDKTLIDKVTKESEIEAAREKQSTYVLKACDALDKIETDILAHLSNEQITALNKALNKLAAKIEVLKDRINK